MRLRNVNNKEEIIKNSPYIVENPKDYLGKWNEIFINKHNKIYIEIGMGKGNFIIQNAIKYKNINFIGIEKNASIMAKAIEKIPEGLTNLKLIRIDAKDIDSIFCHEINRIYLNFSDPWPKKRHANRRLTSNIFLIKYDKVFRNEKEIFQKTDNNNLFEYSLESLSRYGYHFEKVSLDLKNSDIDDNIMTEYEIKFTKENKTINYLLAKK